MRKGPTKAKASRAPTCHNAAMQGKFTPWVSSQGTQTPVPQTGLPSWAATQTTPLHCLRPHPSPNKAMKPCPSADRVGGGATSCPGPTPDQEHFARGPEVAPLPGPDPPRPAPILGGVTSYKSSELSTAASSSKSLVQLGPQLRNKESC